MARNEKQNTSNPLIAGRAYLRLREKEGASVQEIAEAFRVSIPAVYKYMQLAECDEDVQNSIENGDITATMVISILHKHDKKDVYVEVRKAVEARKLEQKKLGDKGISKMTVKRRLKELTKEIDEQNLNSPKAVFLKEIAEKLISGNSVEELIGLTLV